MTVKYLLTAPVLAGLPSPPDATQDNCGTCGTPVWIEKSSASFIKDGAVPTCIPCAADHYNNTPVAERPFFTRVTPEQREELGDEVMSVVDKMHPLTFLHGMAQIYRDLMKENRG